MTDDARKVMNALVEAWNQFNTLKSTHPDHVDEFRRGIHACQKIIMHRIVQRDHPDDFPMVV